MSLVTLDGIKIPVQFDLSALQSGLAQLKRQISSGMADVKSHMKGAEDALKSVGDQAIKTGSILSASVTAPIIALGKGAVDAATRMDSLKRALTAVSGSSKETEAQLVRLKEIAKLPGLGFEEAVKGSLRLQNAGMSARDAERQLAAFGNAIARAGGGKAELDGVTLALGQIATKGKISQEEINQLVERGINLGPILKKAFGSADTEKLQKAGITTKQFFDAILPELEKLPKVTGGAQNAFENLADATQQSLAKVGDAILPVLLPIIEKITAVVQELADRFKKLSPDVQQGIVVFAGLAAILGPVLVALGAVATAVGTIGVPVAAAIAAVGALGALFATNVGGIRDSVMSVLKPAIDFFVQQFQKVRDWIDENMPLIQRTVQTILRTMAEFWEQHGQQILAVVGPVWDAIKTIISTALDTILGIIKLTMQIINGDWSAAWNTLLNVVGGFGNGLMRLIGDLVKWLYNTLVLMVETTMSLNGRFLAAGLGIGKSLGSGITQGLRGAWDSMVSTVKGLFGAGGNAADEFGAGGDFGGPSGTGGADISGFGPKFKRTGGGGKSSIPVPTGPKPVNINDLLGSKSKKIRGKTEAQKAAERAVNDKDTAEERSANDAVKGLIAQYNALLKVYKENGGIKNLEKLRDLVKKIAALEQGAARVKFDNDKIKNPKSADAVYKGEFFGANDNAKKRDAELYAAKAAGIKRAQKRDADAGVERANQVGRDLDNEAEMQRDADDATIERAFVRDMRIAEADENVRLAKIEINRQIERDTLSRFDFERAEVDRTVAKYLQAGVDIATIEKFKNAELARIRGEELKDAQTKADAAAKLRVKAESAAARQMRQIFRGVGDEIGRVAEESIEHWEGFKNFFASLGDSIKATMAKLVANIVTSWAKLQLLGGAKSGFGGADGIGGILGSLFGKGPGGIAGGTPPFVPGGGSGAGGAVAAAAGGKGGIMGLLGKGGLFGGSILQNLGWFGGGLAINKLLGNPLGKIGKGLKRLFKFDQGGILPTGVPSMVAEKGTGGEMIVPRTPSMAIPQNVLKQLQGGGGNRISIQISGAQMSSDQDLDRLGRRLGMHVQRALVTARPESR